MNFSVYTGKTSGSTEYGLGEKIVLQLSQPFLDLGFALFCDNFFSSIKLSQALLVRNTFICATTRSNRRRFPTELANRTMDTRGEHHSIVVDDTQAVVWKDKKNVHFLNTYYDFRIVTSVKRKQQDGSVMEVSCPTCVKGYNKFMGGVDLCDQKRKLLSCSRKSTKWYMRLFWFLIDICIVNAFILEQQSSDPDTKRTQKQFRLELASHYIHLTVARKRTGRPRALPLKERLTARHFAIRGTRRRCVVGSKKDKIQRRTAYYCQECDVGLCPGECFKIYHTNEKYWC